MGIVKKKELAQRLRVDPRQRFYLQQKECEAIVQIIIDHMAETLKAGDELDLEHFANIFMAQLKPRRLWNYKIKAMVDVPISYTIRIKLRKHLLKTVKKALKEKANG